MISICFLTLPKAFILSCRIIACATFFAVWTFVCLFILWCVSCLTGNAQSISQTKEIILLNRKLAEGNSFGSVKIFSQHGRSKLKIFY